MMKELPKGKRSKSKRIATINSNSNIDNKQ